MIIDDLGRWDPEQDDIVKRALRGSEYEPEAMCVWLDVRDEVGPGGFTERGHPVEVTVGGKRVAPDLNARLEDWLPYPAGHVLYFGRAAGHAIVLWTLIPVTQSDISEDELSPYLNSDIYEIREAAKVAAGELESD